MKHLVHITPSFAPGGAQVRTVMLMNHFGRRYRHTVISLDERLQAAARIAADVSADCITVVKTANPAAMGMRLAVKIRSLKPDAVLTYNWGSMDGAVAAAVTGKVLIHTEDGFGPEEATGQKRRRAWARCAILRAAAARVVAPSMCLARIMRSAWHLPEKIISYIPNGVDLTRFRTLGSADSDEVVIGTVGHLRSEKNLQLLLSSVAAITPTRKVRVLIAGDGPERHALETLARMLGIRDRVEFAGWCDNVSQVYGRLDLFALTSETEQMPLSVLEAMASGLPVVSTDVGDVRMMVSDKNRPFVTAACEFSSKLTELALKPELRRTLGAANRAHCEQVYSVKRMFAQYQVLYESVLTA